MKILIIEDERDLAEAVKAVLQKNNYAAELVFDGEYGLDCALTGVYDIIILDIMLPKMDGFRVVKNLRDAGVATPVLMLTARGDVRDKVAGLDSGADDYLPKPFHMDELLSRLRALGRRSPQLNIGGDYKLGGLVFNPHSLTIARDDSEHSGDCIRENNTNKGISSISRASSNSAAEKESSVELTLKESQLLELLIERKNSFVSKDTIIEKLWSYDADVQDSLVESQVSLLRKKLAAAGGSLSVKTARGVGYRLEVADDV